MTTRFDRAMEIQEWLENAATGSVVERLEQAEHEAFLWHVVSTYMSPKDRAQVEELAATLLAGGYRRNGLTEQPEPAAQPSGLIKRLMARVKGQG